MIITDDKARRMILEAMYGSVEEYEKRKYDYLYFDHKIEMKKEGLELQSIDKFEEDE